jgi:L-lactate dehydrogenase (cytochrome)
MGMINTFRSVVQFDRITLDPVERRLRSAASVEDFRRIAKRRLPHGVFDYIDGGAED